MALITAAQLKQLWQKVADWVDGTGAPKVTVDSSTLPSGAATDAKLDSILAELTAIKDTDGIKKIADGVQLTGSNVEVVFQAPLAMTTTLAQVAELDISDASEFYIVVTSTLNQTAQFYLNHVNGRGNATLSLKDAVGADIGVASIATNRTHVLKPSGLNFAKTIRGMIICAVAPTAGSIAVYVVKRGKI